MAFLFSVEMDTCIATEDFITVFLKIVSTCSSVSTSNLNREH